MKEGGALTTNGAYIYAFRGAGSKKFWRYDPVANTWLARKDAPQNVKWGGALTRIGNYIYATRGDDKRDFWRYDITANTWSILAAAPGTFKEGGALTTDGTVVYALRGDGAKDFWRYNPSNNQWTTLLAALQNVKAGGALAYVPGTAAADYITAIRATPTLVSNGKQIEVTMLVSAESAVNNVTPSALTVTPVNGAGVSPANCGSPTPPNQNLAAGVLGSFTWTCTVSAGANPGSLTFSGSATGIGPVTFPAATSNSILVTPVLSYTGAVSASPGVSVVRNNAIFSAGGGGFDSVPSNTTETAVTASIGDRVWSDVDGDGVQDAGEPGLAGVEVCATPTGGGAAMCDTTDVNGAYRIYGLTNGATYNAALTPGTIPIGYAPTFTPTQPRTATTAGESNTDFGLRPPGTASIGDYVWLDADNDGVQDPTENGLPNITVKLYIDQNNNGSDRRRRHPDADRRRPTPTALTSSAGCIPTTTWCRWTRPARSPRPMTARRPSPRPWPRRPAQPTRATSRSARSARPSPTPTSATTGPAPSATRCGTTPIRIRSSTVVRRASWAPRCCSTTTPTTTA